MIIYKTYKNSKRKTGEYFNCTNISELEQIIIDNNLISNFLKFNINDYCIINNFIFNTDKINISKILPKLREFKIFIYPSQRQLDYWICRGHLKTDAIKNVSMVQSFNGKNAWKDREKMLKTCKRRTEYWINIGYSDDEARKKVSEFQTTFTLEKCIQKYGKEKGTKKYNDRQKRWQQTLWFNNTKKDVYAKALNGTIGNASKESLTIFLPLIEKLINNNIISNINDIYIGIPNNKEYFLWSKTNKQFYLYDFTIKTLQIIIEYNGLAFHVKSENDSNSKLIFEKDVKTVFQKQNNKIKCAIENGFNILILWSDVDAKKNIDIAYNFILEIFNERKNDINNKTII